MMNRFLTAAIVALVSVGLSGQVYGGLSYSTAGSTTTVDFTGFTGTGFTPSPSSGQLDSNVWNVAGFSDGSLAFGGTATSGDFARGTSTGAVTGGGVYSFNTGTSGPGLGFQPIGADFSPGTATLRIVNDTGIALSKFDIAYDIFVFNDQGRSNSFNFSYGVGPVDGFGTTTFNSVNSLDFVSGEAADSSPAWTSTPRTATIDLVSTLNVGEALFLQWSGDDISGGGSRDEFALDNIRFSAVPEPSSLTYGLIFAMTMFGPRKRR